MATAATVVETPQNPTEGQSAPAPAAPPALLDGKAEEQSAPVVTTPPSSDAKPSEAKAPEPKAEEVKPAGAPEKYEFKAPEGMTYDPQVLEEFSTAAREANLTQDAAQKVIEKMAPAIVARQQAQVESIHRQWAEASSTDKEFGGDKFEENLGTARKTLSTFSTPAFSKLLKDTGLQHHPEMLRHLVRVGKAISEDGFVGRSQGPSTVNMGDFASLANALYPPKKE